MHVALVTAGAGAAAQIAKAIARFVSKAEKLKQVGRNVRLRNLLQGLKRPRPKPKPPTNVNPYDDIAKFRQRAGLPEFTGGKETGAVARLEVDGRVYFGVNSGFQPKASLQARRDYFAKVKKAFPEDFEYAKHLGHMEFMKHAEAHALIRAARRGILPKKLTMYVDKATCDWCRYDLEKLLKEICVDELTVYSGSAATPMIIKAVP